MKLTSSVVVAVVCCTAQQVAASTAHVYTYEPHRQPSTPSILSPVEARLVLAQRAGVEDYHEADLLKHDVLDAVNTYGARTPLFTSVETEAKKAFVLFEGTQDVDGMCRSLTQCMGCLSRKERCIDPVSQHDGRHFTPTTPSRSPQPRLPSIAGNSSSISQRRNTKPSWRVSSRMSVSPLSVAAIARPRTPTTSFASPSRRKSSRTSWRN